MVDQDGLLSFVLPFYNDKDIMHNFSHINRVIKAARSLAENYKEQVDEDLIIYGCYFHGFVYDNENVIRAYLESQRVSSECVNKIVQISWESQKDQVPISLEGKIIHDAHLLEGGITFTIVKSLITGTVRGQTLEQTIEFIERNLLGKAFCYLPAAQRPFSEKESFTKKFLQDLKAGL